MTIRIIRDLADDFRMPDASACLALLPTPFGIQQYAVAWGRPADLIYGGTRPLGWSDDDNTAEEGVEWFDTLEEAEAKVVGVIEAHAQTDA